MGVPVPGSGSGSGIPGIFAVTVTVPVPGWKIFAVTVTVPVWAIYSGSKSSGSVLLLLFRNSGHFGSYCHCSGSRFEKC